MNGSSIWRENKVTFDEYDKSTWRTWNTNPNLKEQQLNAALGLGEAGEVQNLVKKRIFHLKEVSLEKVDDELGDVLYYVSVMAQLLGTSLERLAIRNKEKLEERYPDGFREGVN